MALVRTFKGGRDPRKGMDDLLDENALGALGWVLLIFILLVLFGVIGFSINA